MSPWSVASFVVSPQFAVYVQDNYFACKTRAEAGKQEEITQWFRDHFSADGSAPLVGSCLPVTFLEEVSQNGFVLLVCNMHFGSKSHTKCILLCYGLSSALALVSSSSSKLSSSR